MRSRMLSFMNFSRRKGRQTRQKVRLASHTDSNKIGIFLLNFRRGTFQVFRTSREDQHKTILSELRRSI